MYVKCGVSLGFSCISLKMNEAENLFMCLLAICISSVKKCQLIFCSLKNRVIYTLIVEVKEFFINYCCYQTWFAKMFSYVVGYLFTFLRVSFEVQRFLILIKVQFTLFPLLSLLLALCLRNYCLIQGNKVWYLCSLLGVLVLVLMLSFNLFCLIAVLPFFCLVFCLCLRDT